LDYDKFSKYIQLSSTGEEQSDCVLSVKLNPWLSPVNYLSYFSAGTRTYYTNLLAS